MLCNRSKGRKRKGLVELSQKGKFTSVNLNKGVILGHDNEDDEAMKPYVFKFNELCVFAGYQKSNEGRQWFEIVMHKEEDEGMLSQNIKVKPNQNFGEGEDGTTLSHSEEPTRELNSTSLDSKYPTEK